MSEVSDLIKIAQHQGAPLFRLSKGDVSGHEFHGNQYTGGGSTLTEAERNNEAHAAARSAQLSTSAADKASKEAGQKMDASAHRLASSAHVAAAAENQRASRIAVNERDRYFHAGMAEDHSNKAAYHARRVSELAAR